MSAEMRLAQGFLESHPGRAAVVLERMTPQGAAAVLSIVAPRSAGTAVAAMTGVAAADAIARLEPEDASRILASMPMDAAVGVLRSLPDDTRTAILGSMPRDIGEPLAQAVRYPAGTAGAIMDPSVFRVPEDVLVVDARTRLRRAARHLLYYVYVVDREHRLAGVLDIPELMIARPRDPVSAVMHRQVERLSAWTPVALVREHSAWRAYHAMPVVDEQERLVGAVRYQTLRRLEQQAAEGAPDASQMTTHALGELFRLGTTALVAGVAASGADRDATVGSRATEGGDA